MNSGKTLIVLVGQLLLAGAVAAAIDIDADLMRAIDDTAKSLDSNVSQKDGKDAAQEARELVETFGRIESHYAEKPDTADAAGFAHHTQELAAQALKAIDANDFDGAADAVNQLTRSCKSCHDVYKKE
jgi:cytochrome c556